ncbi:hypothetical protein [Stygiolobus caldivivus]|uniref:Uncharacterized protein n=1 Tax=Stygiolobus caldivivus TaxID=2824673 RepID=A0A8D5U419_9CREN|nr:hypothetical protein [Stygiolobus caldivivus]BCU69040.1 hypothetical protein KN1_03370 [Stygiolobus caldivivus]
MNNNIIWSYIIALGIVLIVLNQFIVYYPPFTILGLGMTLVGLSAFSVNIVNPKDSKLDLLVDTFNMNLEKIYRYYGGEKYYRLFTPSSMGANGLLMTNKYPIKIKYIAGDLVTVFDDGSVGIFIETPASFIIKEMKKRGITFVESDEFLLRKALVELYDFSQDVKVTKVAEKDFLVTLKNPDPDKYYGIMGYIQGVILASIIAEKYNKISFIEDEKMVGNDLQVKVGVE